MKKKILFLFIVLTSNIFSQQFDNVGTSVANFLKIGIGSRIESMGGAGIAFVNDPTSMYWNVAGLAHQEINEYTFSNNDWISDVNQNFIGVGIPLSMGTLGIQINYLSMGEMKVTTWEKPEGTGAKFQSFDALLGLAFATRLSDRFSFGVQGKFITEQISQSNANAIAMDIGARYDTEWNGLAIGMVISNFGSQMRMDGRDLRVKTDPYPTAGSNPSDVISNLEAQYWSLPLYFQIGTTMDLYKSEKINLIGSLDYRDERDYKPFLMFGSECNYDNFLYARFGVNQKYNLRGENKFAPTFGGGVRFKIPEMEEYTLKIDYSYSNLLQLIGAQRITISILN